MTAITSATGTSEPREMSERSSSRWERQNQEPFGRRVLEILNGGALAFMLSIGHRTGLFDSLANLPPATSLEIARRAGLSERYVREWLGALVVGGVVDYDPTTETYRLPAAHTAMLTRQAASCNLAVATQWLAILGSVEDHVVQCFRKGGGVHDFRYSRAQDVIAEQSAQSVVASLRSQILPLVTGLPQRLEAGARILDVGCGSGAAILELAAAFPRSLFTGLDISPDVIAQARHASHSLGLKNVRFLVRDASQPGISDAYDLITAFDSIHVQAHPARTLGQIHRSLRGDGVLLMQDVAASSFLEHNRDHPLGPFLYAVSCMHCMTLSLAHGGVGLGAVWGQERAVEMLREAGFMQVQLEYLPNDFLNVYIIARKSETGR